MGSTQGKWQEVEDSCQIDCSYGGILPNFWTVMRMKIAIFISGTCSTLSILTSSYFSSINNI